MSGSPVENPRGGTIDSLLLSARQQHGRRAALAYGDTELDYHGLDAAVERLAERIRRAASARGDGADAGRGRRVAIIAPNVPALVVSLFACWRLGAVAVPLNARLRERELSQILEDSEASVLLSVRSHLGYSFADLLVRLAPLLPSLRACLFVDTMGEVEEEAVGALEPQATEPLDRSIAAILYTSGSTGAPKGALVRHAREVEGPPRLGALLGLTPDDVSVFVIPISHAFGLTCLLASVATGGTAALVESTFSPKALLETIERSRAAVLHGSPSLFTSLLKARPNGLPSLRTGFVAGAPSSPELFRALERTGTRILNMYGLTETGPISCCRLDDSPELRVTTAGRPLPGFELRIRPVDSPEAPRGELQVRGPFVTPGYHRQPEETERAFDEGWFRTGDLGTLAGGRIRIVGRAKDVVHVAGFTVFPAEVEAALLAHPDVVQACVVGIPHEALGEALRAFVVLGPGSTATSATLLQFARQKIASYKLPYELRILAELPLLASGKPDRIALHELSAKPSSAAGDPDLARAV